MLHITRTNPQNCVVDLKINSLTDSNSNIIVSKHDKVIVQMDFIGIPTTVRVRRGTKVHSYCPFSSNSLTLDITEIISFPFLSNTSSPTQLLEISTYYTNAQRINISLPITAALFSKSYPFREKITPYRQIFDEPTLQLFSPFDGFVITPTSQIPILQGINEISTAQLSNEFYVSSALISTFDYTFDYTFQNNQEAFKVELERPCSLNDKGAILTFINYQGEKTSLLGYVTSIKDEVESENYRANTITNFYKQTKQHIESTEQTLELTFPNITRYAYPMDIMLNNEVELTYNGVVYKCSPVADSIETTGDYQDYTIKLKIL